MSGLHRERMPKKRKSEVYEVNMEGYNTVISLGKYEDGSYGEVFIDLGKEGSDVCGWANAFAIAVSLGLQHGVPPDKYIHTFKNMKFGHRGKTDYNGYEATSVPDLIMQIMDKEG